MHTAWECHALDGLFPNDLLLIFGVCFLFFSLSREIILIDDLTSATLALQKEFLDKYESFAQLVTKIYPNETIPSVGEMRDLLASM